jgi:hypothetical protein
MDVSELARRFVRRMNVVDPCLGWRRHDLCADGGGCLERPQPGTLSFTITSDTASPAQHRALYERLNAFFRERGISVGLSLATGTRQDGTPTESDIALIVASGDVQRFLTAIDSPEFRRVAVGDRSCEMSGLDVRHLDALPELGIPLALAMRRPHQQAPVVG